MDLVTKLPMTRVLIADGQLSLCHQLRQMLERRRDIQVVGETSDASSTLRSVEQLRPDILVIDLELCRLSAPLEMVSEGSSPQRTIVMLASIDNAAIVEAVRFGARGILMKSADPALWWKTIRRVMDGQYCFESGSMAVLLEAFRASFSQPGAPAREDYGLTARELQIVTAVAAGHSNSEVGQRFSICERTVKHHLTSIFGKVGVSSRLELALFALKHRLVAEEPAARRPLEEVKESPDGRRSAVGASGVL